MARTWSLDRQKRTLERIGRRGFVARFRWTLAALAAGLGLAGLWTGHPVAWMGCAFTSLVAWSAWQASPQLVRARKALAEGRPERGTVGISLQRWSDSDSWQATLPGGWQCTFIPQGWTPQEGTFEADLYRLPEVPWPVLAITATGLVVPREQPRPSAG